MQKTEWIYESPDKGNTVYRRRANSTERELIKENKDLSLSTVTELSEIVQDSNDDPVLKDMLDKLQVYWRLKNAGN